MPLKTNTLTIQMSTDSGMQNVQNIQAQKKRGKLAGQTEQTG